MPTTTPDVSLAYLQEVVDRIPHGPDTRYHVSVPQPLGYHYRDADPDGAVPTVVLEAAWHRYESIVCEKVWRLGNVYLRSNNPQYA